MKLYLLDSNDSANFPAHRGITSELYGGGPELRLKQELLLGIGGWRLLRTIGLQPEICHLNEGHAAFAVLERAQLVDGQHTMEREWPAMRIGEMKVETTRDQHVFEVQVDLNDLDPNAVRVELYADGAMAMVRCGRRWIAFAN